MRGPQDSATGDERAGDAARVSRDIDQVFENSLAALRRPSPAGFFGSKSY
ncbi:MAG: hypothetical protein M3495_05325 [Pseudomonadota bacterium]|nr:hypothetical protein [Pseudomonadota bacterium]